MATQATFRTMMNCLGLSNDSANHIFVEQQIDSLDEIAFLDAAGISNLLKSVRRGGHQIPDPENPGQVINAPGFLVSNLAEDNFKILAHYLRHTERVSRLPAMPTTVRATFRGMVNQREEEKYHTDPDTKPSVLTGNLYKTQDDIREWLRQ